MLILLKNISLLYKSQHERTEFMTVCNNVDIEELDGNFTLAELNEALNKINDGKAPGEKRISGGFHKYRSETLKANLLNASNCLFITLKLFLKSTLYNKKSKNEVSNNKGITFLNASMNIYTSI